MSERPTRLSPAGAKIIGALTELRDALKEGGMSEQPKATLREAAHTLYDHFRCGDGMHPYITSIGEGANVIHVWLVRKPMRHERQIPESWEGWPVETRVTGRMRLC